MRPNGTGRSPARGEGGEELHGLVVDWQCAAPGGRVPGGGRAVEPAHPAHDGNQILRRRRPRPRREADRHAGRRPEAGQDP